MLDGEEPPMHRGSGSGSGVRVVASVNQTLIRIKVLKSKKLFEVGGVASLKHWKENLGRSSF